MIKNKLTALAAGIMIIGAMAGQAFAENPPVATHMEYGPQQVSFRVWHFPGVRDGVNTSGYYEYFDIMMDLGKGRKVLDTSLPEPVLQATPINPGGTEPVAINNKNL